MSELTELQERIGEKEANVRVQQEAPPDGREVQHMVVNITANESKMKKKHRKGLRIERQEEQLKQALEDHERVENQRLEAVRDKASILQKLIRYEDLEDGDFGNSQVARDVAKSIKS